MSMSSSVRAVLSRRWGSCGPVLWALSLLLGAWPATAFAQTGTVTGSVTNAATAAVVTTGTVVFCNTTTCVGASINAAGAYTATLSAGTYVAYTSTNVGLANEIFDDIPCPGFCDSTSARNLGTPIVVTSGGTVSGRNFALTPGATVSGTVTDGAGAPIANAGVTLMSRFDGRNFFVNNVLTNASGAYSVTGLGAGDYYAYTFWQLGTSTHTNEIYGDILCPGLCSSATAVNSGSPITVAGGGTTSANFTLDAGGTLTGTITNAATSSPLANVNVVAYARIGSSVTSFRSGVTNASGVFTINGLAANSYFVVTSTSLAVNEVHNNHACLAACSTADIAAGDPVPVGAGATATVNMALDPGGSISGTLTEAGTGTPVSGSVAIYRPSGTTVTFVGQASTNASGAYTVSGLTTGTYFALSNATNYVSEVYNGVPCFPCFTSTVLSGTPISVTSGANTPNINLDLDRSGTITGTLTNAANGATLASGSVTLFRGGATPVQVTTTSTNSTGGYSFSGLPAGSYYVASAVSLFNNQVYNGVACPSGTCSTTFATTNGSAIPVAGGATVTNINFALGATSTSGVPGAPTNLQAVNAAGGVQFTWSPSTVGGAASSYVFEAGVTSGTTIATLPVATNSLTIPGVPPGTFYVRVRGVNASGTGSASSELVLRVGAGGVVIPNVPTALVAWMSAGRLTVTWTAPTGAVPTGYLLEVGSAPGLSNLATVPVTNRSFTFLPVPSGFYFIRIRALVGAVAGQPTADVMVNSGNVSAPPSEPQNFFVSVSSGTATFTWSAPLFGPAPTSYVIEAGTATGLSNIAVFSTGSTATTLVVPGVPSGTYYLRLRAVNAAGSSPVSNERTLVVP